MTAQVEHGISGFTPDQALKVFRSGMLDTDMVEAWVNDRLHPDGKILCPACREELTSVRSRATFAKGGRVACLSCNRFFTNRTDTILQGSTLSSGTIYLLAVLTALKTPRPVMADILQLSIGCIRKWQAAFAALEAPLA